MGIMQDKYLNVSRVAEELVMKNIWPSYIQIDKHFNATPTGRSYSRYYLRKWKDKIEIPSINRVTNKFKQDIPFEDCGEQCNEYRKKYKDKFLCPLHYTVRDI